MSDETPSAKLWAGRFTEPTDALVERFTESVSFDHRLAKHDIRGFDRARDDARRGRRAEPR